MILRSKRQSGELPQQQGLGTGILAAAAVSLSGDKKQAVLILQKESGGKGHEKRKTER